ncbi:MAG: hypothetical protein LBI39_03175 [Puniceicoccales bacterium]|jgi:dihydrofolate synthase/folylpolyglutamate synthase|nr:hypothetical protein [Puniceicoccales bacterium]
MVSDGELCRAVDAISRMQDWTNDGKWPLERMIKLLGAGGISRSGPFIQVAGTNGKGSTCAFLECGLRAVGLTTGLYTSPDLIRCNERIRVGGKAIGNEAFMGLLRRWKKIGESMEYSMRPTWFELLTAIALDFFRQKAVDVAILEVGLGGRCDATSAVFAELCAITTIGLDHCALLGNDVASIAREKAAIARHGVALIVGNVPGDAMAAIGEVAGSVGAPVFRAENIAVPQLENMRGVEQLENYRMAAAIGRMWLGRRTIDCAAICEKFLGAMAQARWPGRWDCREIFGRRWIFDCTHNVHGLEMFRKNWNGLAADERVAPTVVICTLGEDRARDLIPFFASIAKHLVLVELSDGRALSVERLGNFVPPSNSCLISSLRESQLADALPRLGGDPILVVGSIALVGKALGSIRQEL